MSYPARAEGLVNSTIRLFSVISIRQFCTIFRTLVGEVLPLCRNAVGVFYSSNSLGNPRVVPLIWHKTVSGAFSSFQTSLVQEFKIVADSWKFSMLLLYILWDDWPIFMISGLNEQLQQQLEYTLLKPDRGGRYSFPWMVPLHPWYEPYIPECWARRHQVLF